MATLTSDPRPDPLALERSVPSLRANFGWTLAGNVCYGACQWGMLSALAKLGSPSILGQFTIGLAISAPIFMFTNLQLRFVQATDVKADSRFADYFTLRSLATAIGLLLIIGLLPFVSDSAAGRTVILLVSLSKCVECMSDVVAGLLQREEQLKRVSISLMIRGAGSVAAFSYVFARSQNLVLSVSALCGVWLLVFLFYDVRTVKAFIGDDDRFFRFDTHAVRKLAMLGLPLGWVAVLASLSANIPRYFLQHSRGVAEQGIYASIVYPIVAINLVVFALSQSVTTRLARLFAGSNFRQFVRLLVKLSSLGVLIAAVGSPLSLLFGRPLLKLLYSREYADHASLLALLVGIAGISTIGSFVFCALTAARTFQAQVPVYFIAIMVEVAASAVLIPRFGLSGAAVALLVAAVTVLLGGLWMMRAVLRSALYPPPR